MLKMTPIRFHTRLASFHFGLVDPWRGWMDQQNLDNWKSSRRKRVEHIIDRVVEVKKLEEEEHDRNRRKSKTFNELMEKR
jgi:Domain of unknown function (DUF4757)